MYSFCARIFTALSFFLVVASGAFASESSGTINASFKNAKVCHSVGCVTPTPGVINFKPTGTTPVTIDDTNGVDGIAWGNELGWITFDPTGPEGVTINTSTGVLAGKAWSQVSGWVNFAPTGQTVTVNSSGEFAGWAWTGGPQGGWIKFDCTDAAACIKTDWRPLGSRTVATPTPSGGNGPIAGGGGGGGSPSDICWNLGGIQFEVPQGYTRNGNDCQVTSTQFASVISGLPQTGADICPNISGVQSVVPAGYLRDTGGLCVPTPDVTIDTDRDGIPDSLELGDSDQDTVPDYIESNVTDTDGDGVPNHLDADDDGDGYPTVRERTSTTDQLNTDFDGDGIPSYLDAIFNAAKKLTSRPFTEEPKRPATPTSVEESIFVQPQSDAQFELPNSSDPLYTLPASGIDADYDNVPDSEDPVVASNTYARGGDSDGDGIPDADECGARYPCADSVGSGVADYLNPGYPVPPAQNTRDVYVEDVVVSQPDIVHLTLVPRALQIPITSPAFTEGIRWALDVPVLRAFLNDPAPGKEIQVDAVSLGVVAVTGAAATFSILFSVLKVFGLLALII